MARCRRLMFLAFLAAVLAASCGGNKKAEHRPRMFIQNEYSEARVIGGVLADKAVIDFTGKKKPEGITFQNIEYEPADDGLKISPQSADPAMVFENDGMRYNMLEVELSSSGRGHLEVFWSRGDDSFDGSRMKRVTIGKSDTFKKYAVNLWDELNPALYGYKFRIDPIDKKVGLTFKSITFYRIAHSVSSDYETPDVKAGKVKIHNETREAFVLQPGRQVERAVEIGKDDVFSFGLSKFKPNDADCLFQVVLERPGRKKEILFDKHLAVDDEEGWSDYELSLGRYAGKKCKIILTTGPLESGSTGLVFCSNPMISSRVEHPEKPNVLLISIDTLGARHLSLYGGVRNTDPFLRELARQGVVFENAFANSSVTHVSHGSMLTGLEPLKLNFLGFEGTLGKTTTLAEILRDDSYITAAFTGGVLVADKQEFDKGFESFYQEDTLYIDGARKTDIDSVLPRALKWAQRNSGSPFFLFVHSYEPHGPYYKREKFFQCDVTSDIVSRDKESVYIPHMHGRDRLAPSEIGKYVVFDESDDAPESSRVTLDDVKYIEEVYNSEIGFVDERLREFFEHLRKEGLLENTIVIFTADHGEAFFEHELLEHGLLYDENLRIPLIFWAPALLPADVSVNEHVSTIDIVPTVLDLLGIEPQGSFDGHTLKPFIERKGAKADHRFYSFVPENGFSWQTDNKYKFILRASIQKENYGKKELFDLANDPLERKNLLKAGEELPDSLKKFAEDTIQSVPGIHISFADFADGQYEMKLSEAGKYINSVYGFNIEMLENNLPTDPANFLCKVRFGAESELVIKDQKVEGMSLLLKPQDSSKEFLFVIRAADLGTEKNRITAPETDKALLAWIVKPTHEAAQRTLSPEEEEKLRSLGYIQ